MAGYIRASVRSPGPTTDLLQAQAGIRKRKRENLGGEFTKIIELLYLIESMRKKRTTNNNSLSLSLFLLDFIFSMRY